MSRRLSFAALTAVAFGVAFWCPASAYAQHPDAPARIVLLVDSSGSIAPWINQFRAGLSAFLAAMPEGYDDEIALISTGSQLRIRVPPTTDRQQLRTAVAGFAPDGGGNAFLESLLEADARFLKTAPELWPVFVILTTDLIPTRGEPNIGGFNRFVRDFVERRGSAHAIVIRNLTTGLTSELALNLAQNTGGIFETMALATSLPARMEAVADQIFADHHPRRPVRR
jgi:hypothetical protein